MTDTVIVLGGGVGGLTAAHELAKRGFSVTVLDKRPVWGGKARSADIPRPGGTVLPGEHGFRFFPGFYKHVSATMRDIPDAASSDGTVFGNLVEGTEAAILQTAQPPYIFSSDAPTDLLGWFNALVKLFSANELGLTEADARFFAKKLLCYAMSCDARQKAYHELKTWWEYVDADNRSSAFKKILGHGLVHSLVAMPPERASTRTVGTILLQMFNEMLTPNGQADRLLNGPTSKVWIEPWIAELTSLGVTLHSDTTVNAFNTAAGSVSSVSITDSAGTRNVTADHYVSALPVEILRNILTPAQKSAAGIAGIDALNVEWMTGILFYTSRPAPIAHGHVIYADAGWALTSISQGQFWDSTRFPLSQYGSGNVADIISAIISDWNDATDTQRHPKKAKDCTPQELYEEAFAQLAAHQTGLAPALTAADVVDSSLDLSIHHDGTGWVNHDQLLVNTADSYKNRPLATTALPNFYLASDFVRTTTDLATMESANEAGRMAAQAILQSSGVGGQVGLWPLREPAPFPEFQLRDDLLGQILGYDRPSPLCDLLDLLESGIPVLPAPIKLFGF